MLHCGWVHLGSFRNYIKLDAKQGELVQLMRKFLPRSHVGIFHNERTQSAPLDPKLMFWCVSYYLGAFVLPYNTQSKTGQLVQLFVPQSRVGIFPNERTRSTPLDTKLLFSCNLYYFGAFGTIWLPYKTRCRTGRSSAKVHTTKSHQNFSR